jgi:putative aldouronate transport system permease protein
MYKSSSLIQIALKIEKQKKIKQKTLLYIFLLFPMVSVFIFHYLPIYGIIIAFKDYKYFLGYLGSPWNNFRHFKVLFTSVYFLRVFKNTLIISSLRIIFSFPAPILFALLLNEIVSLRFKKVAQTISYLPHFLSWVVLAGIIIEILSPQRGLIGWIYNLFDKQAPLLLTDKNAFVPLLIITGIWKEVGWSAVIYLASLSSIDPGLYESASIDGANRLQKAFYITLPSLIPVMIILFILSLGRIMNAGFDQVFNLYNPVVYKVADIIDTYVYRMGILEMKYDFTTAVGLFKNVIGVFLIVSINMVIRKFSEYGIW